MLDKTDLEILHHLKENARQQLRDIGEKVHLTGQAVSNRIQRLESIGIIKGYTVILDESKVGRPLSAFITVFMKTADHQAFQKFILETDTIIQARRISGDGCYLLEAGTASQEELNLLLDSILKYGNYKLTISIGRIK